MRRSCTRTWPRAAGAGPVGVDASGAGASSAPAGGGGAAARAGPPGRSRGAEQVGDVAAVRHVARGRLGAQAARQGQRQAEADATLGLLGVAPAPRAQVRVVAGPWRPVGHRRPPRPLSGPVVVVLS